MVRHKENRLPTSETARKLATIVAPNVADSLVPKLVRERKVNGVPDSLDPSSVIG